MADYKCTYRTNYFQVTDEEQYEKLAEGLRDNMDMAAIYEMLGLAGKERRTHHEH